MADINGSPSVKSFCISLRPWEVFLQLLYHNTQGYAAGTIHVVKVIKPLSLGGKTCLYSLVLLGSSQPEEVGGLLILVLSGRYGKASASSTLSPVIQKVREDLTFSFRSFGLVTVEFRRTSCSVRSIKYSHPKDSKRFLVFVWINFFFSWVLWSLSHRLCRGLGQSSYPRNPPDVCMFSAFLKVNDVV